MTLAVCIMPSLQHDMLAKLNGVLDDMSSLAMDNVHTQVYFSIFESMTILSGL